MDILYDFCLQHGIFAFLSSVRLTIFISLNEVSLPLLSSLSWIYIPFFFFFFGFLGHCLVFLLFDQAIQRRVLVTCGCTTVNDLT